MPIYEYHCNACGREFEAWQKINDAPVGKCEHCGSAEVAKMISSTSFHLKGGGWYVTDYARKGGGSGSSSSTGSSSGSSSSATPAAPSAAPASDTSSSSTASSDKKD